MTARALFAAALALIAAPAAGQDFAVTGATLAIGDGSEPVADGTVLVRDGKVVAAGAGVQVPAGVRTIDGTGKWVTPGLFAAVTDLGLWDVEAVSGSNDTQSSRSPFGAALDVAPAINAASEHIAISRAGGITRASVRPTPGNSIFAGQGALIDLGADREAVTRARTFQYVVLGEDAAGPGGGSRVSAHALFRNALREARDYAGRSRIAGGAPDPRLIDSAAERGDDVLLTRFDAAALIPVVTGEQTLHVSVERAADILAVLDLMREFPNLKLVIVGAAEGWLVADAIAAAGVPVLAQALRDLPSQFETLAATQSNVGRMKRAGVKVALGGWIGTTFYPRWAPQYAGNLVALSKLPGAAGLTWGEAFAAISSAPAEISGLGGQAGVLKPGAFGDVVIWDNDPLELGSAPVQVFIDGLEQPLDNHQTRLRDRYRTPTEGDLPKAYDW